MTSFPSSDWPGFLSVLWPHSLKGTTFFSEKLVPHAFSGLGRPSAEGLLEAQLGLLALGNAVTDSLV